jgi:hypothetical protein
MRLELRLPILGQQPLIASSIGAWSAPFVAGTSRPSGRPAR